MFAGSSGTSAIKSPSLRWGPRGAAADSVDHSWGPAPLPAMVEDKGWPAELLTLTLLVDSAIAFSERSRRWRNRRWDVHGCVRGRWRRHRLIHVVPRSGHQP